MEQLYTDFTLRIPIFVDGKPSDKYMDFFMKGGKTLTEIRQALKEELRDSASLSHIKKTELDSFILGFGVWDELTVTVIKTTDKTEDMSMLKALPLYMANLRRSTESMISEDIQTEDNMVNGIIKTDDERSGSISARLELYSDNETVRSTIMHVVEEPSK